MALDEHVHAALARARLLRAARRIFATWPNLEAACRRLGQYVWPAVPGPGGAPLLAECVTSAVRAYVAAEREDADHSAVVLHQRFIVGLLADAPQALRYRLIVTAADGARASWEPFIRPISEFLAEHRGVVPQMVEQHSEVDADAMRVLVAARILTVRDLQSIGRLRPVIDLLRAE